MNEKQVKKWAVVSFILCYVFLMVPLVVSVLNNWSLYFVTLEDIIGRIIVSVLILLFLILMVYSDNLLMWLDRTRVGKWILAPVGIHHKK